MKSFYNREFLASKTALFANNKAISSQTISVFVPHSIASIFSSILLFKVIAKLIWSPYTLNYLLLIKILSFKAVFSSKSLSPFSLNYLLIWTKLLFTVCKSFILFSYYSSSNILSFIFFCLFPNYSWCFSINACISSIISTSSIGMAESGVF